VNSVKVFILNIIPSQADLKSEGVTTREKSRRLQAKSKYGDV